MTVPPPGEEQAAPGSTCFGPTAYDTCRQMFGLYPLAVMQRSPDGPRSMVLTNRGGGPDGFSVLTEMGAGRFGLRHWDGPGEEIRAGEPVSGRAHAAVTGGMPVPRHGAILGWVTDRQVPALRPGAQRSAAGVRAGTGP